MEMIRRQNGVVQVATNNLLQKFFITSSNHFCNRDNDDSENGENREEAKKEEEEEDKDLELSLGLSLNGQFGTDLSRSRKRKNFELSRSSSIPEGFVFFGAGEDMRRSKTVVGTDTFQLDRTRSLPVKTEMEETENTKRMRSEKTRAFMEFPAPREINRGQHDYGVKDDYTLGSGCNGGKGDKKKTEAFIEFQVPPTADHNRKDSFTLGTGRNVNTPTVKTRAFLEFQVPTPSKERTENAENDGFTLVDSRCKRGAAEKKTRAYMEFQACPTDQNQKDGFTLSPGSEKGQAKKAFMEFQAPHGRKDGYTPRGKNGNNTTATAKTTKKEVSGMEKARNILEDMPCVSTREVGADGKRVEGFLYWYGGNKEEVKIVCVCHGSFLSPAEFVRHGGGGKVSEDDDDVKINPLRHIVVKLPSSSL